ncbi:MAG: ImmA/IrrE family metallo-endopeptidase [Cryomorphaceae bacterium]|nr:MAG: ImmA/IrrE family metallo-endopeptidase [Cryomorphaceae bacterium]
MTPNKHLKNLIPGHLIHPGDILLDELKFRKISQNEFAGLVGIQKSQLNEMLQGKRDFNTDVCVKVAAALDMDESIWLNLMQNYEVDKAKINNRTQLERIAQWKEIKSKFPVPYLKKQNIITGNVEKDIPHLKHVFGTDLLSSTSQSFLEEAPAHYRKSLKRAVNPHYLEVWKKLIAHKASDLKVKKFDAKGVNKLTERLKTIFRENESVLEKSETELSAFGIKLVHLAKPDHCAVEGISFWQAENPVIGLSVTYDRIDNYAFNLFHELGHVYLHLTGDKQNSFVDFEEKTSEYANDPLEKEANRFAQNQLIDPAAWDELLMKCFKPNDDDFIQFAEQQQVHPAIVFGRFCLQMNSFKRRTGIDRKLG